MAVPLRTVSDPFSSRASYWRLRTRTLHFSQRPLLMGIVNVTPDSFSDGGQFVEPQQAVDRALQLVDEGADLLDIGGESTRPYAEPVAVSEELRRVAPVVDRIAKVVSVPVSIDTNKAEVARMAIAAGVEIINDVTGLQLDPAMLPLAVEAGTGVCAMHMQGTPQTMQVDPRYRDVVAEICQYLHQRREALVAGGVDRDRICLDPGIGFGKTHEHNITLMANCDALHDLGCPILVGHSRKGFLAKILGGKRSDRSAATIGAALSLARQGVQVIRVHDVRPVREALLAFAATGGFCGASSTLAE